MKKQRIIMFIGPDMSGKTNIAQALSSDMDIPYFKNEGEQLKFLNHNDYFVNTVRYAEPFFTSYLRQSNASIILDRGYPCEWVYSQAFNRKTDMIALKYIDQVYAKLDARIVLCMRSSYANIVDDAFPDHLSGQKLEDIALLYRSFSKLTKCKMFELNVDDMNIDSQVEKIKHFVLA